MSSLSRLVAEVREPVGSHGMHSAHQPFPEGDTTRLPISPDVFKEYFVVCAICCVLQSRPEMNERDASLSKPCLRAMTHTKGLSQAVGLAMRLIRCHRCVFLVLEHVKRSRA